MKPPYSFALLATASPPGSNDAHRVGPCTLGIEVTDAGLAANCDLGVIDPQHGFGGGTGRAAIEAALNWPLPPLGATLATIRADADAIGAMALLSLRAAGPISEETAARVRFIAECDSFSFGPWSVWIAARGPLMRLAGPDDVTAFPSPYTALAALAGDRQVSLNERVSSISRWLTTGEVAPQLTQQANEAALRLANAWNQGELQISRLRHGQMARVRSTIGHGLQLGYRFAPVVIAESSGERPRKVTVAQFAFGHVDLTAVRDALNAVEPGWGGSATILGSPQGVGSHLSMQVIEGAVEERLRP